jgi:hypothetical protein
MSAAASVKVCSRSAVVLALAGNPEGTQSHHHHHHHTATAEQQQQHWCLQLQQLEMQQGHAVGGGRRPLQNKYSCLPPNQTLQPAQPSSLLYLCVMVHWAMIQAQTPPVAQPPTTSTIPSGFDLPLICLTIGL